MKIVTTEHGTWYTTAGHRRTEWSAIDDDTYDGAVDARSPMGLGETEDEAIADLLEQLLKEQLKEREP